MKKCIDIAFAYAMAALVCGIFYREFTKAFRFEGRTTLAFAHVHLFVLGTMLFLLLALFSQHTNLMEQKKWKLFLVTYQIGLPLMVILLLVRGIVQVKGTTLTAGATAALSGCAGLTHIIITVGLLFLFLALRQTCAKGQAALK